MSDRHNSGGNLIVAIIIAIIVGLVVYFLIDSKPVGAPTTPTTTGSVINSGEITPEVTTGQ